MMLCETAFASAGQSPTGPGMLVQFLPFFLIFVLMYFLMIRPQQKRLAAHRAMVESLDKGSKVITSGGIVGVITRKKDAEFRMEIADGVEITVLKSAISGPYTAADPAEKPAAKKSDKASARVVRKGRS